MPVRISYNWKEISPEVLIQGTTLFRPHYLPQTNAVIIAGNSLTLDSETLGVQKLSRELTQKYSI